MITYTNPQYYARFDGRTLGIRVEINGMTSYVPIDPANSDYQQIMKLVEAGELTIAPAEEN